MSPWRGAATSTSVRMHRSDCFSTKLRSGVQGTACGSNGQLADESSCDQNGCAPMHVGNLAEMTLSKNDTDFYDISNSGVSVTFSFAPEVCWAVVTSPSFLTGFIDPQS